MTMSESSLHQRIFDQLFQGLALTNMLHKGEINAIAHGLAGTIADGAERALFKDVAKALRDYAEADE